MDRMNDEVFDSSESFTCKKEVVTDGSSNESDLGEEEVDKVTGNVEINIMNVAANLASSLAKAEQIIDRQHRWKLLRCSFDYFMKSTVEAVDQIVRRRKQEGSLTSGNATAKWNSSAGSLNRHKFNNRSAFDKNNIGYLRVFFTNTKTMNVLSFAKFWRKFTIGDLYFQSIGQAYQYIRLMNVGKWEVAERVRMYRVGIDAFRMAERECPDNDPEWMKLRKPVMLMVLKRFSEQHSNVRDTLRKNGYGTKYLAQWEWAEGPVWGCPFDGIPDGVRWQNLYGACLSELADFLLAGQPLPEIPNSDVILSCCKWQVEPKPPGNNVFIVADRQLKDIEAKAFDTQLIHASEMSQGKVSANPSPDQSIESVKSMLDQCSNLSEVDCIVLAVTSDDVLRKRTFIDQAYTELLSWLVQQTNALIYIVGGFPRKWNGTWNPAVDNGNNALRCVCQKFVNRAFFIDIPALIQQCGSYPTESLYTAQFLDPKKSYSELDYYGQIRLASLISSAVPVCSFVYFDQVNIIPLSESMANTLVANRESFCDYSRKRQITKRKYKNEARKKWEEEYGCGFWKKGKKSI